MIVFKSLATTALAVSALPAMAQISDGYPIKPVRMIVASTAGGGIDIMARNISHKLSEKIGQKIVVDNRGGAGGNIAIESVARSPADGYTLGFGVTAQFAVNPSLYGKMLFDTVKDLAPVALLVRSPYLLVAHPSVPARSVKELIALAKARPSQITFASSSNGSGGHLCGEMLNTMAGIELVHIPYKGSAPSITDLIAGHVQVSFLVWGSSGAHITTGKLRALAVTTTKRLPTLPDMPAIAETLPGYDLSVWYGIVAPAATPKNIVTKLNTELLQVLGAPDFRQRMDTEGAEVIGGTPEQFGDYIKSELVKWAKVVRDSSAKID